jgi:serine/threonine protein kinase
VPLEAPPCAGAGVAPFTLGRYRVTGRLGSGSFGTVYKGHDDDLSREVAIKVFHPPHLPSWKNSANEERRGMSRSPVLHLIFI